MDIKLIFVILVYFRQSYADSTGFCNYFDPCEDGNHYPLYIPQRRSIGCKYQQDNLCDDLMSSTWYIVNEPMINYCPGKSSCGALYPVWLDGTEPTIEGELKYADVCVVGLSQCCERRYQIQMKKCENFVAYCLPNVQGCPERYCFGSNKECEAIANVSKPVTTTGKPTTTRTTIRKPTRTSKPSSTTTPPKEGFTTTTHGKYPNPTAPITKTSRGDTEPYASTTTPATVIIIKKELNAVNIEVIVSMTVILVLAVVGAAIFFGCRKNKNSGNYKPSSAEMKIETSKYAKF